MTLTRSNNNLRAIQDLDGLSSEKAEISFAACPEIYLHQLFAGSGRVHEKGTVARWQAARISKMDFDCTASLMKGTNSDSQDIFTIHCENAT